MLHVWLFDVSSGYGYVTCW